MRSELGDRYVNALFKLYDGKVPREADLVCYWFEKARTMIEAGRIKRAGLLATNSIRSGANRKVLQKLKDTGDIFWAQSDREWVLDGAAVNVSMVAFDHGEETIRILDDAVVETINPDLTGSHNTTNAQKLSENAGLSFMGVTPAGDFDIPGSVARQWLTLKNNPNGRPNSDVVKPYFNGLDITRGNRDVWIIDFGVSMALQEASQYEKPFEYVKEHVYPVRSKNNRENYRVHWWLFAETRSGMRNALRGLNRYIGKSMVAKHHVFSWVPRDVIPANLVIVITREDEYFFGVLHSRIHEVWALKQGTSLEDRPRYTPTTTFETFPFPYPPGKERQDDCCVQAIARAAKELVDQRDNWLNTEGLSDVEKKKRTLTNLYNKRPTWLDLAHKKLDEAVFAAYGWKPDMSDEEILAKLLDLNLERSR